MTCNSSILLFSLFTADKSMYLYSLPVLSFHLILFVFMQTSSKVFNAIPFVSKASN
jgi:hypothetical protein